MRVCGFARVMLLTNLLAACGGDSKSLIGTDGPIDGVIDGSPVVPATLGAHAIAFQRLNGGLSTLSTPALATKATGSTIVVSVGRGAFSAFALPTDNKGNAPYMPQGAHTYTRYPDSGTALYTFANAQGGAGHVVSASTPPSDEITLAAVEVTGTRVQQVEWSEVLVANLPLTSKKVTTTGPATLVAFWWGDAGVDSNKTAVPNNGFVVIDSVLASGALVQSAVAVKQVTAPGSYDVTWTSTPAQGAQLWIVAIQ
jgi:hypothetical protein